METKMTVFGFDWDGVRFGKLSQVLKKNVLLRNRLLQVM